MQRSELAIFFDEAVASPRRRAVNGAESLQPPPSDRSPIDVATVTHLPVAGTQSVVTLPTEAARRGADTQGAGAAAIAAMHRLNQSYFIAPDGAGKTSIYLERTHPSTGQSHTVILNRSEFLLALENEFVEVRVPSGGTKRTRLGLYWLSHADRRQYEHVGMWPGTEAPIGSFNLWSGWGVEPRPGDVAPMSAHVSMLCTHDPNLIAYVLGWLAYCVQFPGKLPEVAVIFRGGQGTGKGTLLRLMCRLFGVHGMHITQPAHLVGHFNAHLRSVLFLFVDEGFWAGDRAGEGVLKGLITEPTLAVEMKGRDVFSAPNFLKVVMATNNNWAVPAGADARRYCVIDAPSTRANDHAYFAELNEWIDAGGAAAWLHFLMHHDISEFNVRAAPSTAALDAQKLESLKPIDRWVLEALDQGTVIGSGDRQWLEDGTSVVCSAAVKSFEDYCKRAGGGRWAQADARQIGARLNQIFDCGPSRNMNGPTSPGVRSNPKSWPLPGLTKARSMASTAFGLTHFVWGQS